MINSTLIQRLAVVFIALLSINIAYADEFVNLIILVPPLLNQYVHFNRCATSFFG